MKFLDNPFVVNFWSSIVAGGSSTMVTNPIWVIKTRLMSQVSRRSTVNAAKPPWHYRSTWDAARKMYKTEGFLSFYSGLTPALLGLTHVAVQFPAYEYLKTKFTGQGMGMSAEGDDSSHLFGVLSASVLSKIMASSATYPHEVIRTRLQTQQRSMPSASSEYAAFRGGLEGSADQGVASIIVKTKSVIPRYKGIVTTFKTILREEGWRAFYAGMGTNSTLLGSPNLVLRLKKTGARMKFLQVPVPFKENSLQKWDSFSLFSLNPHIYTIINPNLDSDEGRTCSHNHDTHL